MMQWKKDPNMKYTDLCIYIDKNVEKIAEPGANPVVENTIYNYLWLLVKALSIKKRMFNSFEDYDGYSFYAANRLYFALRKNLQNQGKIIKGKLIKPIKSCLNYTKALLNPMKIEYLRENSNNNYLNAVTTKSFDAFEFKEKLKADVAEYQGANTAFIDNTKDIFKSIDVIMNKVLAKSPFPENSVDYKKLKISLLLNCVGNLKKGKPLDADPITTQVWKLPKSTAAYVKVFLKTLGMQVKTDIMECYESSRIANSVLEYVVSNPEGETINHEDQY